MLHVEDISARTCERRHIVVTDGITEGVVPLHVIVGQQHRPCLGLVAGVHGDEYNGMLALQEIARELQPSDLVGSVVVIPVANPFAFAAAQRRTPQDNKDLNRVCPGTADGSLSDRLAHALCAHVLYQVDLALTIHGGGSRSAIAPWIECLDVPSPLGQASYEAARASGFPDIIPLFRPPGTLLSAMELFDVPLVEGEVGGQGSTRREDVQYAKDRVYDVARHVGVLPGRPGLSRSPPPQLRQSWPVIANADGILLRTADLHQEVSKGDQLGRIIDIDGEVAAVLTSPVDGVVGGYETLVGVRAGDHAMTLWSLTHTQSYAGAV